MKDGIYEMLPREQMAPAVRKYWDFMERKPGAAIYQKEFGFYSLEKWQREEGLEPNADLGRLFGFDEPALVTLCGMDGCEAPFLPPLPPVHSQTSALTDWSSVSVPLPVRVSKR